MQRRLPTTCTRQPVLLRTLAEIAREVPSTFPSASGRSRVVWLDAGTVAVLREHRKRQLEERMKAGPAWHETGLVFTAGEARRSSQTRCRC